MAYGTPSIQWQAPLRSAAWFTLLCFFASSLAARAIENASEDASASPAREDFESALALVERRMSLERWALARALLVETLAEHEGQTYVLERRIEIEEILKRCAFWKDNDPVDPKGLVSGDLQSYNKTTGNIKINYTPEQLGDFDREGTLLIHPAAFDGQHTVLIEGKGASGDIAILVAFTPPDSGYLFSIGNAFFLSTTGKRARVLDQHKLTLKGKQSFKIKLTVGKTKITVSANGKKVLSAPKDSDEWGALAIQGPRNFKRISISGRAEKAWIQGLQDAAIRGKWEAFEKTFDRAEHVPAWLLLDAAAASDELDFLRAQPGEPNDYQKRALAKSLELLRDAEIKAGLELADDLDNDRSTREFRTYVELLFRLEQGNLSRARILCERLDKLEPDFVPTALLRGRLLTSVGQYEQALDAYASVLEQAPETALARGEQALLLLLAGRADDAREAIRSASADGLTGATLDRAGRALVKFDRGPDWVEANEARTRNYHVFTDLNRKTAQDVGSVLEEAHRLYQRELGRAPRTDERFRVYIFSGEASYQGYSEDLWGSEAKNTLGYYVPAVKQLLVWNAPQREDMLRTVRHEGLHQYLDSITSTAPRWLHEGLAEYFEVAEKSRSKWVLGSVHPLNRSVLQRAELISLETFLNDHSGAFMANAGVSYAQSWAFIHYLRHGEFADEDLVGVYIAELVAGSDTSDAYDKLFGSLGSRLERGFRAYVSRLAR